MAVGGERGGAVRCWPLLLWRSIASAAAVRGRWLHGLLLGVGGGVGPRGGHAATAAVPPTAAARSRPGVVAAAAATPAAATTIGPAPRVWGPSRRRCVRGRGVGVVGRRWRAAPPRLAARGQLDADAPVGLARVKRVALQRVEGGGGLRGEGRGQRQSGGAPVLLRAGLTCSGES